MRAESINKYTNKNNTLNNNNNNSTKRLGNPCRRPPAHQFFPRIVLGFVLKFAEEDSGQEFLKHWCYIFFSGVVYPNSHLSQLQNIEISCVFANTVMNFNFSKSTCFHVAAPRLGCSIQI